MGKKASFSLFSPFLITFLIKLIKLIKGLIKVVSGNDRELIRVAVDTVLTVNAPVTVSCFDLWSLTFLVLLLLIHASAHCFSHAHFLLELLENSDPYQKCRVFEEYRKK